MYSFRRSISHQHDWEREAPKPACRNFKGNTCFLKPNSEAATRVAASPLPNPASWVEEIYIHGNVNIPWPIFVDRAATVSNLPFKCMTARPAPSNDTWGAAATNKEKKILQ